MKKVLTFSTKAVSLGLSAKEIVGTVLHPLAAVRNFIKKIVIKSIVGVIKKGISLSTKNSAESHIVLRQISALGSADVDMTGLEKHLKFQMTLDTLLEEANDTEVYKLFNLVDMTNIKNKMASYKNSLRMDAYDYITEKDFENLNSLVHSVNEVLKMPTEIVGCEFAKCSVAVASHDEVNKDFVLDFDVCFSLKSS